MPRRQERLELEATEPAIAHKPLEEYLINTHSLHNPHLLWKAIPHTLIAPVPLFPQDQCQSKHAKATMAWRANPKSYTTQEQVRWAKKEAVKKGKGKHRKKRAFDKASGPRGQNGPDF